MYNKSFLKGMLPAIVLKLLAENGRMYGYQITQAVKELSKGEVTLTEGALYPLLHELENANILISETEIADNRLRKYYRIAPDKTTIAQEKVSDAIGQLNQFTELLKVKII